jgi:hypothetical protein
MSEWMTDYQHHCELLRTRIAQLEDHLKRVIGDHHAPSDCYSTGPLTGTPLDEMCPSCAALTALSSPDAGKWLENERRMAKAEELERQAQELMAVGINSRNPSVCRIERDLRIRAAKLRGGRE